MKNIEDGLKERIGEKERAHFFTKILPNILSDFNAMAKGHSDGITISEEYKLDDGSFSIFIYGHVKDGSAVIERAEVCDQ